ncbi:MAG: endopeptidase La, partial [Desulfobacteraceae bacterium]|nr:endopeptidase La [Desulfobacteraceae bacterium]
MVFFRKEETPAPATANKATAGEDDFAELQQTLERASLPVAVAKIAATELERLKKTDPSQPEYAISHNYLTFLADLPWSKSTDDTLDLKRAQAVLDAEHFGLGPVKER